MQTSELELQRALVETILARLPAGVFVTASDGQVVMVNERARKILGAQSITRWPDDFEGWTVSRLDGAPYALTEWPISRALAGETAEERVLLERPDGTQVVVDLRAAPIRNAAGDVVYAATVAEDVTERERHERVQREFVTNAAHELQTPLAAIVSASEVLDAGAKEEPADRDRFLGHIRRECERLTRLVRALLTLARAQGAAQRPPVEPIDLRGLLDGIALAVEPRPGVEVRVECPARLVVETNRPLLEQAITALATNAAKYTPAGSIWLRCGTDGDRLELEVADEGQGLPPGTAVEDLFERFERGGRSGGDGFGLGLAIVREAVTAIGGEVSLRPRRGGGTSALLRLPRTPPA